MGKRKKNKRGGGAEKTRQSDADKFDYRPFAGDLGQRLKAQRKAERDQVKARVAERFERHEAVKKASEGGRREVLGASQLIAEGEVEMTDEELFEAALKGLDPVKIDRGKYGGRGPVAQHVKPAPPAKPRDPYEVAEEAFAAEFMEGEIKRLDHNLHVPEAAAGPEMDIASLYNLGRDSIPEGALRHEAIDAAASLEAPELTDEQRALLKEVDRRGPRSSLPATNLRGMSRDVALGALESAYKHAQRHNQRYIRVITGKGIRSVAEPVLKVALVQWCTAMSVRYAPEVLVDGTCGSFILHVVRQKRRS